MSGTPTPAGHLRLIALSLYWIWVNAMFNSSPGSRPGLATMLGLPFGQYVFLCSLLGGALGFALALVLARQATHGQGTITRHRTGLLWGTAVLMAVSSFASCLLGGHPAALGVSLFVGGLCAVWLLLAWAERYALLGRRDLVFLSAASLLVACVAGYVCEIAGPVANMACAVICPLALRVLLLERVPTSAHASGATPNAPFTLSAAVTPDVPVSTDLAGASLVKVMLFVGALMFASSVLRIEGRIGLTIPADDPGWRSLPAILGALIQVGTLAGIMWYARSSRRSGLGLDTLYKVFVFALVAATAGCLALERSTTNQLVLRAAVLLASNGSEFCTWVLLVDVARRCGRPVTGVVAQGRLVVHLSMAAGTLAAAAFAYASNQLLLVCLLVLVIAGFFLADDPAARLSFDIDVNPESLLEGEPISLAREMETRAERFAAVHGLSKRECEVFTLWITSHGLRQIEGDLGLSEATVKTHIRHIYAKCDVHSRGELVRLVEGAGEGDRA